jgi:hypothetical protein
MIRGGSFSFAMLRLFVLLMIATRVVALEPVQLSAVHPRDALKTATLRIERLDAEVTLRGMLAETQATLTLAVDADPALKMEGRLVFTLPPHCTITGAALDIGDIMRPASVTFKEIAKKAYDAVVSRILDPCLVQLLPDGRVSVQVFPFTGGKPRKVRLEFAHLLAPGKAWEFPLRFADPTAAHLKTDAPFEKTDERFGGFNGGEEWRINVAEPDPGQLLAHPDGRGGFVFQKLVPAGAPSGPPRHLLVLADASLLQASRDAAAERALLDRLLQSMGDGRTTLATFSTALHSQKEFAVEGGKCEALLAALAALEFDGAPRPGAINVSAIPADLTLVLSTLAAPMGGGRVPTLPPGAPVWVADSVSPAPSTIAERLAEDTGGKALDPRQAMELVFHPRPALEAKNVTGLTARLLPGGQLRLVTGTLDGENGILTADGMSRGILRGEDAAAGRLAANFIRREEFRRRGHERNAAAPGGSLRENHVAPFLNERTAFIVLEEEWQYRQFGIPLPPDLTKPDLTKDEPRRPGALEQMEQDEFDAFIKELQRPAGTASDPYIWYRRLKSQEKRALIEAQWYPMGRFLEHREPEVAREEFPEWLRNEKEWNELWEKAERGAALGEQLAVRFAGQPAGDAADLIRQAREQQVNRVKLMEWLGDRSGLLHSGWGPGLDPLHFRDNFSRGGADPFAGGGTGAGSGSGFGSGSAASNEPFGPPPAPPVIVPPSAAPTPAETPATPPPSSGTPQVPQTFGGGGAGLFGDGVSQEWLEAQAAERKRNEDARRARELAAAQQRQTLTRAEALHREGKKPEAIRALSGLTIYGQEVHAAFRLLAWLLLEWGEPALALEVLQHAEARFGFSDTSLRDKGLAALAAGRKADALQLFRQASHHVARRDAAALEGRMSAALRVVVECAGADGDVDLEILGPDFELCSWRNPLPAFGGALSFDGAGEAPEDFVLPEIPKDPLQFRVRLHAPGPRALRVTVIENWGREGERRRFLFFQDAMPGLTKVIDIATK